MAELRRYRSLVSDSARWDGFGFRPDDIVITPPGKCGTTWLQMLCALLVFGGPDFEGSLSSISPWYDQLTVDADVVDARLRAQSHRRFIKTHTPLDGLPWAEGVTYIGVGRDPRDVALSFRNHMRNIDLAALADQRAQTGSPPFPVPVPPEDPSAWFAFWAEGPDTNDEGIPTITLATLLHHQRTFWDRRDEPGVVLLHYDDLLADLPGQLRHLAGALGIDLDGPGAARLAEAATFERMREQADSLAPNAELGLWRENREFFHRGSSGQWREVLTPADLELYERRLGELDQPPELIRWLHTGWRNLEKAGPAPGA